MVQNFIIKDWKSVIFGGLGGPGGPGNPSERWGAKTPTFLEGLQGPGRPDPQKSPISGPLKKFKVPAKVEPRSRKGTAQTSGVTQSVHKPASGSTDTSDNSVHMPCNPALPNPTKKHRLNCCVLFVRTRRLACLWEGTSPPFLWPRLRPQCGRQNPDNNGAC